MKRADAVLGPMLKRLGIESGVRLERIRNDWLSIFDPRLSSHMFPAACSEQELLLHVESPAWMQQLTYYKREIIDRLSPYGITEIRFRIGRVRKPAIRQKVRQKAMHLSEEDMSFITGTVSEIKDEELKDTIRKAIEKSLRSCRRP